MPAARRRPPPSVATGAEKALSVAHGTDSGVVAATIPRRWRIGRHLALRMPSSASLSSERDREHRRRRAARSRARDDRRGVGSDRGIGLRPHPNASVAGVHDVQPMLTRALRRRRPNLWHRVAWLLRLVRLLVAVRLGMRPRQDRTHIVARRRTTGLHSTRTPRRRWRSRPAERCSSSSTRFLRASSTASSPARWGAG